MISLYQRLDEAFKGAMKGQQATPLATLRMLRTAIRHREVELKRKLTENEVQAVIASQAKQRREAMAEYTKAGRADLAQKEEEELQVLLSFLPSQLTQQELESEIAQVVNEVGATGPQDLGKVMKSVMARVAGRADGKVVQEMVRRRLTA